MLKLYNDIVEYNDGETPKIQVPLKALHCVVEDFSTDNLHLDDDQNTADY